MRSRTELVTTTFIDSEDDFTETDDSEEDWRPSASNRNVKKRAHSTKGRNRGGGSRKRKSSGTSSSGPHKNPRRQTAQDANYRTFDDSDDDDDDDYEYYKARTQLAAEVEPKAIILPPKKKEKNLNGGGMFQLYLYRKDLKEDYMTNSHLCLWRKDGSNLLQKYIRIKTGIPEEFIFTSSSVYSTWDEKRRRDFVNIAVKCLEENNRRVTFVDATDLHSLAKTELERVSSGMEQIENDEDDDDDDDDDENDIEAEADIEADMEGSEHNSVGSECDDNDGSYHPEEDEVEEEPEDDNIDENEDDEQVSDDDQGEEVFEDYAQIEEEDEGEEEDENIENDDNEIENEAEHN